MPRFPLIYQDFSLFSALFPMAGFGSEWFHLPTGCMITSLGEVVLGVSAPGSASFEEGFPVDSVTPGPAAPVSDFECFAYCPIRIFPQTALAAAFLWRLGHCFCGLQRNSLNRRLCLGGVCGTVWGTVSGTAVGLADAGGSALPDALPAVLCSVPSRL